MSLNIELLLFSNDPVMVNVADQAGMDGFIIDWEDRRKFHRQHVATDQQPPDNVEHLENIASLTRRPVWCRINQPGNWTQEEIEQAITHGADLILLPMVRSPEEVTHFLSLVAGRAQTGILLETVEACACAHQLAALSLDRVYVGLFDLLISRGKVISRDKGDIFTPLIDGTVENLRDVFHNTRFGVGGLTTVDRGAPVPCLEIMAHLVRINCDFTFLRNSFKRDVAGRSVPDELDRIRAAWKRLSAV